MTSRFPSPWMISRLSDANLRQQLSSARTLLMYGHTQAVRELAMLTIERINTELKARGAAA
jgi:hypothetical protein